MVLLNKYFHHNKQSNNSKMSVSGKLEALVGNYYVSGDQDPDEILLLIYYDPQIDSYYNAVECIKENLVACMTADYEYAFVKASLFDKFAEDIAEYNTTVIPISDFDLQECCVNETESLPEFLSDICWIRDDFLSNVNVEFDYEAFERIDNGTAYLNPDHFSVNEMISVIRKA